MTIDELRLRLYKEGLIDEIIDSIPNSETYLGEICDEINSNPENESSLVLATSIMILMVYNGFDRDDTQKLMSELTYNSEEFKLEDGSIDVEWLLKKIRLGI